VTLGTAVRVANMLLRALFVLQLILGLLFWFNQALSFVGIHMLLGILFVATVWFLGVAQGLGKNGSLGLTVGTFVVGLIVAVFGMFQGAIITGGAHWVTQVIHLLLGITAIGLGEASAARYRRGATESAPGM
jgi:hypothetical protein